MTDDEGECLGFNEVQVGSGLVIDSVEYKKVVYVRLEDDGLQKVFLKPCIPVSELKKAIKWLEKDCQDKLSGDMNIGAISWDIFMLKLGLSEKKKEAV